MLRIPISETRVVILDWLKDPATHFPHPQQHGDPATDGVTSEAVAQKLGVSRGTAETHLTVLTAFGLLSSKDIGNHTFYRRDESRISEVSGMFEKGWAGVPVPRMAPARMTARR
ncbi:ArsR family transcriptional regulator [Streptomyces sp. YIM S03343]